MPAIKSLNRARDLSQLNNPDDKSGCQASACLTPQDLIAKANSSAGNSR
jgi:hypothetical protein